MPVPDPAKLGQSLPLRDIHLPPPPGWWPPAPGWWLLAGLVVILTIALVFLRRRSRRLRYRRQALRQLAGLETAGTMAACELLAELSMLLRRAALCAYPADNCACLNGEPWLQFLDRTLKDRQFSTGPGRCLAYGPYQPSVEIDRNALLGLCRRWLRKLPPAPGNRRER